MYSPQTFVLFICTVHTSDFIVSWWIFTFADMVTNITNKPEIVYYFPSQSHTSTLHGGLEATGGKWRKILWNLVGIEYSRRKFYFLFLHVHQFSCKWYQVLEMLWNRGAFIQVFSTRFPCAQDQRWQTQDYPVTAFKVCTALNTVPQETSWNTGAGITANFQDLVPSPGNLGEWRCLNTCWIPTHFLWHLEFQWNPVPKWYWI